MRAIDLFPVLTNSPWRGLFDTATYGDGREDETQVFVPSSYIEEDKERYGIDLDMPGVTKDAVKIEVNDSTLAVTGERKGRYKLRKYFNLPDDVDIQAIEAHHQDGVLRLVLPKTAKSKAREITIKP